MKVTFILPTTGAYPSGGFKVVYEYANRLVARDYDVTIVNAPYRQQGDSSSLRAAIRVADFAGRYLGLKGGYRPDSWFHIDQRVHLKWVPSLHPRWIPDSNAVIATAWETAEWVNDYPESKGCKLYLIQGQETIFPGVDPARVMATWHLPLKKIVISRWLQDIAADLGESAVYIPNGLNFDHFGIDIPHSKRNPHALIMLYHNEYWKGSGQGLQAMELARREFPQLRATLFGVPEESGDLPEWISYSQKPNRERLRKLYNEAAIFVGPSLSEGWGLPGCEALQCGAALCVTDIGGHREYAIHERTALLSPPKDPESLAANIIRLIHDDKFRIGLAQQGHEYISQLTWTRAVDTFEQVLQKNSN